MCIRDRYRHRKRVCTESWLCEKTPLPHQGIEPALPVFQSDALTIELHHHPTHSFIKSELQVVKNMIPRIGRDKHCVLWTSRHDLTKCNISTDFSWLKFVSGCARAVWWPGVCLWQWRYSGWTGSGQLPDRWKTQVSVLQTEQFDDPMFACGSGGTVAGLALGNYLTGEKLR